MKFKRANHPQAPTFALSDLQCIYDVKEDTIGLVELNTQYRFDLVLQGLIAFYGITQAKVARLSGLSPGFVNDLVHGRNDKKLSHEAAEKLSVAFPDMNGTTLTILADYSDNPLVKEIRVNVIRRLKLTNVL